MWILHFRLLAFEAGMRHLCQTRTMSNEVLEKLNGRHENYETFFVYFCGYFKHFQSQCFPFLFIILYYFLCSSSLLSSHINVFFILL